MNTPPVPTLFLNEKIARNNIKLMAAKAIKAGVKFRPHFKTHQSKEVGNWFRNYPIDGITTSSLKMANYFAEDGWNSITIAFPFNILETEEIDKLAGKIDLRVLAVESSRIAQLDNKLSDDLGIYIEIDPGYGRSGILHSDDEAIQNIIQSINDSERLSLAGFYIHSGHTYKARGKSEILKTAASVLEIVTKLKSKYSIPICFGDTPSCSVLNDFGEIDEISPGNFVFYDWIQTQIGSCSFEDIAVAMYCPVVAKYKHRKELLIHGGAVHFSKDFDVNKEGSPYYGVVCNVKNNTWSEPISGTFLKSVSQEHGIISCSNTFFDEIEIGDIIAIIPIHSCLTADLMGGYTSTEGRKSDHISDNYK